MEIKILHEKENSALSRKEITAKVSGFTSSPTRTDLIKELSEHLKTDANRVYIDKIYPHYGGVWANIEVSIYSTPEELNKIVPEKRRQREVKKQTAKK